MTGKSQSLTDDALAREVDKLLRKLPGADPYLRGDPEPVTAPKPALTASGSRPVAVVAPRRLAGPNRVQRITVWVRVCLGALLGAVITQWPYQSACGFGLGLYLAAITAVLVGGGWAGVWSWRYRMGLAHATSLGIIYWGAVLIANQILQRAGYAAVSASWSCGALR